MTVTETLAQLVRFNSVSSRSNAEIISYLANRCDALGLHLRRLPYTDDVGVEKVNLIAWAGSEPNNAHEAPKVELALVGHTDTVPFDPAWQDATNLTELDGKLYGRGSCDTKAFIAAALTAIEGIVGRA